MNTGQIISGVGHFGLIGWALLGTVFGDDPIPFEVTQVTAVSTAEFEAIMNAERPPTASSEVTVPDTPEPTADTPDLSSQTDTQTDVTQPDVAAAADPDATPDLSDLTPPAQTEVDDTSPELQQPSQDVAALLPQTVLRPKPRPAKRVAPEQVAPPDPDTAIDDIAREEVTPDDTADTPREEADATAPEEAATEIVTEAEQTAALAPASSMRPKTRPSRPAAREEPAEQPQTDTNAVQDALAAALGQATETPAPAPTPRPTPSGPPLTGGEKDALRVAVQACWNVGSLSTEALGTTVIVAVEMTEAAKPVIRSIRMVDASGGGSGAAAQAFGAARRAIIRCGARGFDLPPEKYAHWKTIEMTFNPEKMRIK